MNRLLAGFIAGTAATVPMTITMIILHKLLGAEHALPPYEITMRASDKMGFWHKLMGKEERSVLSLMAHFAYGGLAGIFYSLIAPILSLPSLLRGLLYGLFFWAANYIGALPALGLYPKNEEEPPDERAVTISSHLVWGAALSAALEKLTSHHLRRTLGRSDRWLPVKETSY